MCFGHVKFPQIATVRTKLKLSSLAGSARGRGRWPGSLAGVAGRAWPRMRQENTCPTERFEDTLPGFIT